MDGDPVRPSFNLCILHLLHCYRCKSYILVFVILICWCIFDCLSFIFPQSSEFATNWNVFWIVYHQWGNGSVEGSSGLRGLLGVDGTWGGHGKIVNFSNNNLLSWKNWHKKGVKRKAKKRPELALNSWNWHRPQILHFSTSGLGWGDHNLNVRAERFLSDFKVRKTFQNPLDGTKQENL